MHPSTILSLLFLLLPLTLSHSPLPRRQTSSNSTLAGEIIGTDPPQPPSTNGYAINHVALQVSNITRTRAFWGDVLGLRFIFQFSIAGGETKGTNLATFMAYPFGDGEVGYQTGAEMLGELRKRDGVMEFLSYEGPNPPPLTPQTHGFSHIGVLVPNITATQERLIAHGVNILKHVGEHAGDNIDAIFGFERGQTGDLPGGFERLFDGYMVATDPDGYGVEFFEGG